MLIQTNTAPVEQSFWLEPDDFHCMWGPFSTETAADVALRQIQTIDSAELVEHYTGAIRVVRARTRLYPQDWQGEHSLAYQTMRDGLTGEGGEEDEG